MSDSPSSVPPDEDREAAVSRLRAMTQEMIDSLTSPAYVEALRAVKAAPESERLVEASRRLSPDGLRALGVPIPQGMRISSRYFERDFPASVELGDPPGGGPNAINELNRMQPGLVDRLRQENVALYRRLADDDESGDFGPDIPEALSVGGCACGGRFIPPFGPTVCGGGGAYF